VNAGSDIDSGLGTITSCSIEFLQYDLGHNFWYVYILIPPLQTSDFIGEVISTNDMCGEVAPQYSLSAGLCGIDKCVILCMQKTLN